MLTDKLARPAPVRHVTHQAPFLGVKERIVYVLDYYN